ncbi:MAG: acylphosphatase [Candidatus Paceibacterota bacterium]
MKEIECNISGKVVMVMFRDFARRKARGLGIVGEVENLENGNVKVVAQGSEKKLEEYIQHLHKGPFMARVARVDVEWREPKGDFTDFNIRY